MNQIDVNGQTEVILGKEHRGGVRLLACGSSGSFTIKPPSDSEWDGPLEVVADPAATKLQIDSSLTGDITVFIGEPNQVIELRAGTRLGVLTVNGGAVDVGGGQYQADRINLVSGTLQAPRAGRVGRMKVGVLSLSGFCHIGQPLQLRVVTTMVAARDPHLPSLSVDKEAAVDLGEVQPDPDSSDQPGDREARLTVGPGVVRISTIDRAIGELQIEGGEVQFSRSIKVGSGFRVSGYGFLTFAAEKAFANDITFEPAEGLEIVLALEERSAITGQGRVTIGSAVRAAQLRSSGGKPLSLVGIGQLDRSELIGIDLAGIPLADLEELKAAERVEIWTPARRADARSVEESEGSWRDEPEALDLQTKARIAHRWRQLSEIATAKKSTGSSQSRTRYAALHWRRKSLPWRWGNLRENVLLMGYWALGYGERILRPLLAFAAFAAVGAALLVDWMSAPYFWEQIEHYLQAWGDLARSPLSVLRVTSPPSNSEPLIYPLTRLVGIVCLALTLLATRRLARAD